MTNEKIFGKLQVALNCCTEEQKQVAKAMIERGVKTADNIKNPGNTGAILQELLFAIKDDIIMSESKKSGNGNRLKAMKDWQKKVIKKLLSIKPQFCYPFYDGGQQVFVDGYILVSFAEGFHLAIDEKPLNVPENTFNWRAVIPSDEEIVKLEKPDIGRLKTYIKLQKTYDKAMNVKKPHICYDFGEYKPFVDAEKLVTMMDIIPDAEIYQCKSNIYERDMYGNQGLLMGVKPADTIRRKKTEI